MRRYYLLLVSGEKLNPSNQYVTAYTMIGGEPHDVSGELSFSVERHKACHFSSLAQICDLIYSYGGAWGEAKRRRPARSFKIVRVEEVTPAPVVTETVVE